MDKKENKFLVNDQRIGDCFGWNFDGNTFYEEKNTIIVDHFSLIKFSYRLDILHLLSAMEEKET